MNVKRLAELRLDRHWTEDNRTGRCARLRFNDDGEVVEFRMRRCVDGSLRDAYPVSANDVELDVSNNAAPNRVTLPLADLARTVLTSDIHCRRIVFTAPAGDADMITAVEAAGFRYVTDVDIPDIEYSLLVAEPRWVTALDDHRIPDT